MDDNKKRYKENVELLEKECKELQQLYKKQE